MAEVLVRAQNDLRKPLIFPESLDLMAIKSSDVGHNLQP